jgi:hypothetical protein
MPMPRPLAEMGRSHEGPPVLLVATDGSESAIAALKQAVDIANAHRHNFWC